MVDLSFDCAVRRDVQARAWLILSASLAVHAFALAGALTVGYFAVGVIQEPRLSLLLAGGFQPPRPPLPPAAPARAASSKPEVEEKKVVLKENLPEMIQPDHLPEESPEPDLDDWEEGVEGGSADGVPGGLPGGHPDGIPGGDLNGVPGGDPDGVPGSVSGGPQPEADGDQPVYLTGDVRPPERILHVDPEYPEMARLSRTEGRVILEIVVNRDGGVEEVSVRHGHPLFDRSAIEAVKKWRYNPALQSGRAVKVYMIVVIDFKLK